MKNFFLVVLTLISLNTKAQIEKLLKDPKVGWIAQGSTDMAFDVIDFENIKSLEEMRYYNYPRPADIIKLEEIKSEFKSDGYHHFAKILLDAVYNKKVKIYSDSTCTKEVNILSLNIDTIDITDPTTLEKTWKAVHNKFEPHTCVFFRVFQTFIYKPEKGVWEVKTESMAPIFLEKVAYGYESGLLLKPKFWMKVDANNKFSEKNVNWKVRTQSHYWLNHSKNVLKNVNADMPLTHFVNYFKSNSKARFYSGENGWNNKLRLTEREKLNLFKTRIDSIEVINPYTFKLEVRENINKVDSDVIRGIRFVQEWHWDKRKNCIFSKFLAIAPLLEHTDAVGNFLFVAPLFYRRLDD